MQKNNILILGLGAFGYAVARHIGKNNHDMTFFATEKNPEIFESIQNSRKHPYFFEDITDNMLPENIQLIENIEEILPDTDIIISVIPCQFVASAFSEMKHKLKDGVIILNLAKGTNNQTLKTTSETLKEILTPGCHKITQSGILSLPEEKGAAINSYSYAYLAGGMIAEELVAGNMLGANIVTENLETGNILQELFASHTLDINLKIGNPKNTELAAALKNIVALILGYYEGQGVGVSTLGYYFARLTREMHSLIQLLGNPEKDIDFLDYAFSGDLITTCFGNSRNRLLGNMLGEGMGIEKALLEIQAQRKIAEGYETLKGIKKVIEKKEGFEEIKKFCEKYL
ncbi:hypothetical protein LAT59_03100 [Candidatus Gracilibacteria bacterium]|nr:hypothetical protein [Candidatus Gracilibacteria bacterium]